MGVDKSIFGNVVANPLLWFLTTTPEQGALTPLFLALEDIEVSGKLFAKCKEVDLDEKVMDEKVAKRLLAIDRYWTGQISKEQSAKLISGL